MAHKREKKLKKLLARTDPYNTINIIDDEMHRYVPCNKRCDSCTNFVVAKSSFDCFSTKSIYQVRRSTSSVSKNVIYIACCLSCLKQRAGSTVDWKPRLRKYISHKKKTARSCSIVNHFIDVCSDTDDPSKNLFIIKSFIIIDQLNNTNGLSPYEIDDLLLQKKILDLISHMTGIESVIQNALGNDRTYDN